MSTAVYQYVCDHKEKEIAEIAEEIRSMNASLILERQRYFDGAAVILLTFEKYYIRSDGYASLTVMLAEDGPVQTADIICSGGGEGILGLSWGANRSFADMAVRILEQNGFTKERTDA